VAIIRDEPVLYFDFDTVFSEIAGMHVFNTLIPVFAVIGLGALLRKKGFFSSEFAVGLNHLVYWVGLPCLLFYKIAEATHDFTAAGKTFTVLLIGTIACIIAGYVIAWVMKLPRSDVGAFVQGSFRGNLVYVGIPVVLFSLENSQGLDAARLESVMMLALALIVPIYNAAAVIILLAAKNAVDRRLPLRIIRQLLRNPLFLACVAGVLYSMFLPDLPSAVHRTLDAVGQMALPLALICIGAALVQDRVKGQVGPALAASLIKVGLAPLVGLIAVHIIALGPGETRIVMLQLACPAAVASYILTDQLGGNHRLAAAIVIISSLLSIASLALVVGLL